MSSRKTATRGAQRRGAPACHPEERSDEGSRTRTAGEAQGLPSSGSLAIARDDARAISASLQLAPQDLLRRLRVGIVGLHLEGPRVALLREVFLPHAEVRLGQTVVGVTRLRIELGVQAEHLDGRVGLLGGEQVV